MQARLTAIDRSATLQYLQYRGGALPESTREDLARCEALILDAARPRVVWRLFERLPDGALKGTAFRPLGQDAAALLRSCDQVILMAATLGSGVDTLIRQSMARSMADALILDAAGSAAIESVCDGFCAELAERFAPRHLTDRFSPGYGDMPLSQQGALCETLDVTRRIGVSLTESGLMIPQKSVTAILGVSDQPQPRRRGSCESCRQAANCLYRKEGKDCGKS